QSAVTLGHGTSPDRTKGISETSSAQPMPFIAGHHEWRAALRFWSYWSEQSAVSSPCFGAGQSPGAPGLGVACCIGRMVIQEVFRRQMRLKLPCTRARLQYLKPPFKRSEN